jgi:hypothetical protein
MRVGWTDTVAVAVFGTHTDVDDDIASASCEGGGGVGGIVTTADGLRIDVSRPMNVRKLLLVVVGVAVITGGIAVLEVNTSFTALLFVSFVVVMTTG